ncbi:MAG: hypothetical protein ABI082_02725 [Dokdonella sp.]
MKTLIYALAVVATALSGSIAFAQSAPLRGVGLLALDAGESHGAAGGHQALVALPDDDEGGGTVGARALRGSDGGMRVRGDGNGNPAADATSTKTIGLDAPSAAAAETPKRPTYRWQSLVPGAIK